MPGSGWRAARLAQEPARRNPAPRPAQGTGPAASRGASGRSRRWRPRWRAEQFGEGLHVAKQDGARVGVVQGIRRVVEGENGYGAPPLRTTVDLPDPGAG